MKKIYSTMLLALAVAGIAYAGNPLASNSEKYSFAASNQVAGNAMIAHHILACRDSDCLGCFVKYTVYGQVAEIETLYSYCQMLRIFLSLYMPS